MEYVFSNFQFFGALQGFLIHVCLKAEVWCSVLKVQLGNSIYWGRSGDVTDSSRTATKWALRRNCFVLSVASVSCLWMTHKWQVVNIFLSKCFNKAETKLLIGQAKKLNIQSVWLCKFCMSSSVSLCSYITNFLVYFFFKFATANTFLLEM